eukprot:g11378.t1
MEVAENVSESRTEPTNGASGQPEDGDAGNGGGGEDSGTAGGDSEKQYDLVGTIRMFNADKGWGFIDGDAGCKDIFLHAKHFVGKPPNYWIGHKMQTKDCFSDRRRSPTCETCGSTVASRLGLSVCILCSTPVPSRR